MLYFDHAAASFPKAPGVGESMQYYVNQIGVNINRGVYAPAQEAALEALKNGEAEMKKMRKEYQRRRDFFVRSLNECGLSCHLPNGAFYAFADITASGMDCETFAAKLLESEHVALVPGTAFGPGGRGFVRCSYATAMEDLEEAARRIARFMKQIKPGK
jgi:aminotransferase